jgi:tRNA A37 threonylcarbamoyltransferase TsaD
MARRWAIVLSVTATIAAIGLPVLASPAQSQDPQAFTLDLSGKTQELRTKVKFSATATAASTLVAEGKKIEETTKQLAANEKTEIKARLTRKFLHRMSDRDHGQVKIEGTATDQSGATATDTVQVKLRDCPGRGQKADCSAGRD